MSDFQQDLIAQRINVLQNELVEMQKILEAVTISYSTAMKVMLARLDALEVRNAQQDATHKAQVAGLPAETIESGKEL